MSIAAKKQDDVDSIAEIARLVMGLTGVQLNEKHFGMIESRLSKRLLELRLSGFAEYLDYFRINRTQETPLLISLLTTHHTYFFREFAHFEFLAEKVLPHLVPIARARADKTIRIWSAACSRGQEVYSLAMFLDFHLKKVAPDLKYKILGSDVDPESVEIATNGVYMKNEIKEVPMTYLADHWSRGTGDIAEYVKAKKSLKDNCSFKTVNLFALEKSTETYDVIFCRNVFIYFNLDQIKVISKNLLERLSKDGFLFLGISETLNGLGLPVMSRGTSIYSHKEIKVADAAAPAKQHLSPFPKELVGTTAAKPIRVFCIDDSGTIHTLMKQILTPALGFEIVGKAMNGLEASQLMKTLTVDVVTLDIHMPEQDGIAYLEKNFKSTHPPVVMVSSVSRENADLALKALALGASDYVEKPVLSNLAEKGDELRTKLKCAFRNSLNDKVVSLKLDESFKSTHVMKNSELKLRACILNLSDRKKIKAFLKELKGEQPPCVLLIEGVAGTLEQLAKQLSFEFEREVVFSEKCDAKFKPNQVVVMDAATSIEALRSVYANSQVSIMAFGEISKRSSDLILNWPGVQLLLEDLGSGVGSKYLLEAANDIVLFTSFAYLSAEFLCKK